MTQSKSTILDRKIQILTLMLNTYRNMNHLPTTPKSEIVDYTMFLTDWINELEQEKSML